MAQAGKIKAQSPNGQLSMDEIMNFIQQAGTKDLQQLADKLQEQKSAKRESELSEAKEKINEILSDIDAALFDVFPEYTAKSKFASTGSVEPKYRNPKNPTDTWTGRGKRPNWLKHILAARNIDTDKGKIPTDLLIEGQS